MARQEGDTAVAKPSLVWMVVSPGCQPDIPGIVLYSFFFYIVMFICLMVLVLRIIQYVLDVVFDNIT